MELHGDVPLGGPIVDGERSCHIPTQGLIRRGRYSVAHPPGRGRHGKICPRSMVQP